MTEIRCVKCRKLLMKADWIQAEIKCPKCGYINKLAIVINKKREDGKFLYVVK